MRLNRGDRIAGVDGLQTATFASDLDAVMRLVYDTASCAPQLRWMIVFLSV
jgi:hypothetical protein